MTGASRLERLTLPELLRRSFTRYRDLPAIAFVEDPPLTYGQVEQRVGALAADLTSRNIGKGDKVAILGENSPQWVLAYLAVTSIGAVAVPILPGFPDSDARHIIRESEAGAVFVSDKQRHKIDGAELPDVATVYRLEELTGGGRQTPGTGLVEKARHLLGGAEGREPHHGQSQVAEPGPDDLAVILFTSGTTGHSKGVMLTHANIVSDVIGSIERFPIGSADRFLSILPLSHVFEATGGMLCPLAVGASIFYMKGLPAPRRLLAAMQTVRPTGVLMVPLILDKIYRRRILRHIEAKNLHWLYRIPILRRVINRMAGRKLVRSLGGSLRFFMLGGAFLNEDLECFLRDAGICYSTGYGMTEAAPIVTISPFGEIRVGSCGLPIPGVEVGIDDPDPATGIGDIIVRGPNVMRGYYKNDTATQDVFLDGGWLLTGDLGRLDSDGYLYIKGRSKNVIVGPSGENIYPEIIEQHFLKSPYIEQVIVYQYGGKLIAKAYLDYDTIDRELQGAGPNASGPAAGVEGLLERIRSEVNQELPAFSTVQEIREQAEPFEMTPTRKIKRYLYVD